jgi:hypothetical protein
MPMVHVAEQMLQNFKALRGSRLLYQMPTNLGPLAQGPVQQTSRVGRTKMQYRRTSAGRSRSVNEPELALVRSRHRLPAGCHHR